MSTQKLIVIKCTQRPIVLRKPIVERFSHIERLQCDNKLLFELNMLINCAHTLFTRVTPKFVNELEVLRRLVRFHVGSLVVALRLHRKLLLLLLVSLLFKHLVVFSDYLGL